MHMHVCVCVVAADWWQGGSCICMCVCCGSQLVRRWLMHMHVFVLWQLIGEKVAHAYACVCVVSS